MNKEELAWIFTCTLPRFKLMFFIEQYTYIYYQKIQLLIVLNMDSCNIQHTDMFTSKLKPKLNSPPPRPAVSVWFHVELSFVCSGMKWIPYVPSPSTFVLFHVNFYSLPKNIYIKTHTNKALKYEIKVNSSTVKIKSHASTLSFSLITCSSL